MQVRNDSRVEDRRGLALCVGAVLTLALTCVTNRAEAGPEGVGFHFAYDLRGAWIRAPQLAVGKQEGLPVRDVRETTLPSTGSLALGGAGIELGIVLDDRIELLGMGVEALTAIGESARVITSADGTPVSLRPWTLVEIGMLLPGLGVRMKARRWQFAVRTRPVLDIMWMSGSLEQAGESLPLSSPGAYAGEFGWRAELEACRRLDPTHRLCLGIAPRLYEFGFLSGVGAALRWEMGP